MRLCWPVDDVLRIRCNLVKAGIALHSTPNANESMKRVDVEPPRSAPKLRCREIGEHDVASVIELLASGFASRSGKYWTRALDRLLRHPTPVGLPKLGYLLEHDGTVVGVILLIFSTIASRTGSTVRCNISSWYVKPDFRAYASLLVFRAMRRKDLTYLNVSPAPHTRATIEAQGLVRYCNGQQLTLPLFKRGSPSVRIVPVNRVRRPDDPTLTGEFDMLAAHAALGCVCLWCTSEDEVYPFIFLPRRIAKGLVPVLQLVYCQELQDFLRLAGPIGRYLAIRGRPLVLLDAPGPIPGLVGKYVEGSGPKYFKGPAKPRLGDLAFTEGVLFGA
jgi:hypothetical protein